MIEKKYFATIIGLILTVIIISLFMNSNPVQIGNNVTLIVEIGVGTIIAIVVYAISRKSEVKMEEKVVGLFDIVKAEDDFRKKQVSSVKEILLNVFKNIDSNIMQIVEYAKSYKEFEDEQSKEFFKKLIISECKQIKNQATTNLDDSAIISSEFFDVKIIGKFKTLSFLCKREPVFTNDSNEVDIDFCNKIKKMIDLWIEEFSKDLEKEREIVSEITSKVGTKIAILPISVSSDRTVYPLDSTIHVRANIPSVIPGEKIIFELFNSDRKLLLSQEIDPMTYDQYPDLKEAGLYQISFKMQGAEWKIDETYFVKATHSSSSAEDSFSIDQRMPVVQSDKSVYTIGSDMILTVIDPDADKDNQVAEYVGDRDDSKLIIESPYGKIEGYRLKETGNSTAIFQGILGILGIRKDGSVIPQKWDGKIIDKIQGTGIDDGYISGAPGDELTVSYKNNAGTAYLTFFISNFGAAIELDQKVYAPTDKVYITIIAPDFNIDSNVIEEIGRNSESIVKIRTSKDKIEKYQLVETGPNTGIFTGEIQLVRKTEESNPQSKEIGPTNGKLLCDNDDFIEISFSMFGEEVIGRAMIKSIPN